MENWHYTKNGEKQSPVTETELRRKLADRELDPQQDLGWTAGMDNWQPLGAISALQAPLLSASGASVLNPYAPPMTAPGELLATRENEGLAEIPPGSVQLDVMACVKRAWRLTTQHFGVIFLTGLAYFGISLGLGFVEGMLGAFLMTPEQRSNPFSFNPAMLPVQIVGALIRIGLAAGLTRVGLNVCSGREVSPAQLFGEFNKLLKQLGGIILFYILFLVGLVLLIVPGIIVALRLSYFMTAIVDRNMGPVEALKYSWNLTRNNAMNLIGLWFMLLLIALAGVIALLVGLVFAIPVATLAVTLAYRFLQYGPAALEERSGR
ncbi:MAG: GYF domain-containing protein [Verrucomicrobiota bacterium]